MINLEYGIKVEGKKVSIQFTKAEGYDRNTRLSYPVNFGSIEYVEVFNSPELRVHTVYIPGDNIHGENRACNLCFNSDAVAKEYAENLDKALKEFIANYKEVPQSTSDMDTAIEHSRIMQLEVELEKTKEKLEKTKEKLEKVYKDFQQRQEQVDSLNTEKENLEKKLEQKEAERAKYDRLLNDQTLKVNALAYYIENDPADNDPQLALAAIRGILEYYL